MINLVQLHLNRGIKTWYAEINENGVRKYRSLKTKNKKEAMTLLTKLNSVSSSKLSLQTVWERYMESHVYSKHTVSLYNALYKTFPPELLKRHFSTLRLRTPPAISLPTVTPPWPSRINDCRITRFSQGCFSLRPI